jgi:hypothetical protein
MLAVETTVVTIGLVVGTTGVSIALGTIVVSIALVVGRTVV